jgi:phosphatidylserine/phosphatidylglycerophosphate/cardiolipin synthase-like enzyme
MDMKLIVQPDDGVAPLIAAMRNAKESIDAVIFRFDRGDLEKALRAAVDRGVKVSALIAYANRGGEKSLRRLEMRFLEAGITVARSNNDLIRYHDKMLVIDRQVLYVLSFNFTHVDIDRSRGFGIVTEEAQSVAEGLNLLQADCARTPYSCGSESFVVSPVNARKALGDFLKGAEKQLLIYDPKISDKEMIEILKERAKAGVEIRVIGQTQANFPSRRLAKLNLHTRTIIRDGLKAFIGSQSLRAAELDSRRELGLIVSDQQIVKRLGEVFESDWTGSAKGQSVTEKTEKKEKANGSAKVDSEQAVKVLVEELHPIAITVKRAVRKVVAQAGEEVLEDGTVKETVKKVVKKVVREAVKDAAKG